MKKLIYSSCLGNAVILTVNTLTDMGGDQVCNLSIAQNGPETTITHALLNTK